MQNRPSTFHITGSTSHGKMSRDLACDETETNLCWWVLSASLMITVHKYSAYCETRIVAYYLITKCYMDHPHWCNIHNVHRCFQSQTKHSLWSFIVWLLVSTSSISHHLVNYKRSRMWTETKYCEVWDLKLITLKIH
jgi:hypothetical protein